MNDDATAPTFTQLQIKQKSYSFAGKYKLDSHSLSSLNFSLDYHRSKDMHTSHSVVIRRALRVYAEYLKKLKTDEQRSREATELLRAAKGIV